MLLVVVARAAMGRSSLDLGDAVSQRMRQKKGGDIGAKRGSLATIARGPSVIGAEAPMVQVPSPPADGSGGGGGGDASALSLASASGAGSKGFHRPSAARTLASHPLTHFYLSAGSDPAIALWQFESRGQLHTYRSEALRGVLSQIRFDPFGSRFGA